jgi:hypothetical protein
MTMSKRDAFLAMAARPLRTKDVQVGSETFTIREISEADAAEMEIRMQSKDRVWEPQRHRALLVAYSLIDENGEFILQDDVDQNGKVIRQNWEKIRSAPKSLIAPLYEACLDLSKYDEREINDLAKKSDGADA